MGPAHTDEVRAYIASGDTGGLAGCLAALARQIDHGDWTFGPTDIVAALREELPEADRGSLVEALVAVIGAAPEGRERNLVSDLALFLAWEFKLEAPLALLDDVLARAERTWTFPYSNQVFQTVEASFAHGRPVSGHVVALLRRMDTLSYLRRGPLRALLARTERPLLSPGEAWADQAIADAETGGEMWERLLAHARSAKSSKPTATWERAGRDILDEIGAEAASAVLVRWLALVGRPRTFALEEGWDRGEYDPYNAQALRGIAWLLAFTPESPETARALGRLAETALRKVTGIGPVSPKVANAAVYALSRLGGEASVAQLARLATRLTYRGTLKEVEAALDARASALGVSRAEVEETAIPAYGLVEVGRRVERFGGAAAELTVSAGTVVLSWRNAAGKTVKSPPAEVRHEHAESVAEFKAAAKDVAKMLTAQSERLDRLFLARRTWRFDPWRERFLDHPLVGTLARRLLWTVDGRIHGFADGELRTLDDAPASPAPDARVGLWHPIDSPAEEVVAARDWLERHLVTQPFRQAHREIYPITVAEETTGTYSNRYAGHVLHQHRFHALAAVRGWSDTLRLSVDADFPPTTRPLPEWGLRAEFWVAGHGDDTTGSGSYLHLATDQVRFYPIDAPVNRAHADSGGYEQNRGLGTGEVPPLPLTDIPPVVFSEVMRDADLFVGVAGIGNDPTWEDGGPRGRHRDYWVAYNMGELTAGALARRDVLARLLPRLAIGARCRIDGRYLRVTGTLRSYAIHLGSGNVLMSPNGRYLCIVPKADAETVPAGTYLPYEGDTTLSIILSKAMLLARDDLITDPTITRQFG
ncbi:hypothetical protein B4N89_41425 [Embleya scabrispora]|uniref:Uncharacterized protein n=2 Tax=Embleya scabrispora TaxID=159449 RepID=A0A1T3NJL6_9ACTN|nr:hypothetical protein B4N89_41425 [Embleya scabrispora]